MTSFFGELGKRLAEKWISLLLLPSLLLVAVAGVAVAVGQSAALDGSRLATTLDRWFRAVGGLPVASQVLLLGVLLLVCSGVGLTVRALSGLTQRLWLGTWGRPARLVGGRLVERRRRRWDAADASAWEADQEGAAEQFRRAAARRNAISLSRPSRPTWMGDQLAAVEARVHHQYGADLESWWPRLWLVVDDPTRSELRAARSVFDAAALHASWAVGYLVVAAFWWPSAVIAVGVWTTGRLRGRAAVQTYATLVESAVDVNKSVLARRLELLEDEERFGSAVGHRMTDVFRKAT
jgi:hypothetical protein